MTRKTKPTTAEEREKLRLWCSDGVLGMSAAPELPSDQHERTRLLHSVLDRVKRATRMLAEGRGEGGERLSESRRLELCLQAESDCALVRVLARPMEWRR